MLFDPRPIQGIAMLYNHIHRFRLYLSGHSQQSKDALAELREICRKQLPGRHTIEIVDVLRHPERAAKDGITMTPSLIRLEPKPIKKIVGTFGLTGPLMQTLDLEKLTD
jgi:circadian clock protein KaiB